MNKTKRVTRSFTKQEKLAFTSKRRHRKTTA